MAIGKESLSSGAQALKVEINAWTTKQLKLFIGSIKMPFVVSQKCACVHHRTRMCWLLIDQFQGLRSAAPRGGPGLPLLALRAPPILPQPCQFLQQVPVFQAVLLCGEERVGRLAVLVVVLREAALAP